MNTNYAKWEKFDVDEELEEIDRKQKMEEFKAAQVKQMKSTLALEEERQKKTREVASRAVKSTSVTTSDVDDANSIVDGSVTGNVH